MFAMEIGELSGLGHSSQTTVGINQHPSVDSVIVLNSAGDLTQDDYGFKVVRQLLWREEIVNQG